MARLPYTNFHDINLDWMIKRVTKAYTPDNPPPYPVKSVNGKTGSVLLTGGDIPFSEDFQQSTVLDFCDFTLEQLENLNTDMVAKQDAPVLAGSPGDVLSLDADQNPVWSTPAAPTDDYDDLQNRPEINSTTLTGDQSGADLGLLDAPAAAGATGDVLQSNGDNTQSWVNLDNKYAAIITDSASGPVASFPDGANNLPVLSLIADIVPVQAGTGDPSPSNPRPISGRGGISIFHSGINLWDEEWEVGAYYGNGTKEAVTDRIRSKNLIKINPATSYYCKISATYFIVYFDENGDAFGSVTQLTTPLITTPNNAYYMVFFTSSAYGTTYNNDISINYPSSDTGYHPFTEIEPILYAWGDIAGTVYGGTLDVVSGVLTVTHGTQLFNGTETWYEGAYNNFYTIVNNLKLYQANTNWLLCDKLKPISYNDRANETAPDIMINPSDRVEIRNMASLSVSNLSDFEQWINNNNVRIVYPLEDIITYQLTPQEVKTILGTNNIYSDSGDCSVTYRADTKLFILKVV